MTAAGDPPGEPAADYKDAAYRAAGVETVPGNRLETDHFGKEVQLDLNADGREGIAFLIKQEPGGSGTFFYPAAALNTRSGYLGSEALFLGDRIAPRRSERSGRLVVVNYATRAPGGWFSTSSSTPGSRFSASHLERPLTCISRIGIAHQ